MKPKTNKEKAKQVLLWTSISELSARQLWVLFHAMYSEATLNDDGWKILELMHRDTIPLAEAAGELKDTGAKKEELSCIKCGESTNVSKMLAMTCDKCRAEKKESAKYIAKPDAMETDEFALLMHNYWVSTLNPPSGLIVHMNKIKQFIRDHFTPKSLKPYKGGPMGEAPDESPKHTDDDMIWSTKELREAMCTFKFAAHRLDKAMALCDRYEDINLIISEQYPFSQSFDDLVRIDLKIWVDDVLTKIDQTMLDPEELKHCGGCGEPNRPIDMYKQEGKEYCPKCAKPEEF